MRATSFIAALMGMFTSNTYAQPVRSPVVKTSKHYYNTQTHYQGKPGAKLAKKAAKRTLGLAVIK